MTIRYAYALVDPRTNEPRYVGVTVNPAQRLASHIAGCIDGNTAKDEWLAGLLNENMEPQIKVLEQIPEGKAPQTEARWIQRLSQEGHELTNTAPAGGGKITDELRSTTYKSVRLCDRSYKQADELRQQGYESLTNVLAVALDRMYQAEMPKERTMYVDWESKKWDEFYTSTAREIAGNVGGQPREIYEWLVDITAGPNDDINRLKRQWAAEQGYPIPEHVK